MSAGGRSLVADLATETLDWMATDQSKPDVADEVWAFALATHVEGVPVTPRGFDVSETFGVSTDGGLQR